MQTDEHAIRAARISDEPSNDCCGKPRTLTERYYDYAKLRPLRSTIFRQCATTYVVADVRLIRLRTTHVVCRACAAARITMSSRLHCARMAFTRTARPPLTGVFDRTSVTSTTIGFTVLTLHVLFVLGIAFSPSWRSASGAVHPLVLLTELPPPLTSASRGGGIAVHLDLSVAPPRPANLKLPAVPDIRGVILDAAEADSAQVARICGAWRARRSGREEDAQESTVLVRVDADGRVSDTRLLVGSGSTERDAELQHCLLTLARLTPLELDGHVIAAWQRLHAPTQNSSRRP